MGKMKEHIKSRLAQIKKCQRDRKKLLTKIVNVARLPFSDNVKVVKKRNTKLIELCTQCVLLHAQEMVLAYIDKNPVPKYFRPGGVRIHESNIPTGESIIPKGKYSESLSLFLDSLPGINESYESKPKS